MAWSTAAEVWGRLIHAVGSWFGRWWKWVVVALAIAGAFIIGLLKGRKRDPFPVDQERKRIEEEAQQKQSRIDEIAAKREKEVVEAADQKRIDEVQEVKKDTDAVQGDLQKSNEYLLNVGEDMRKP